MCRIVFHLISFWIFLPRNEEPSTLMAHDFCSVFQWREKRCWRYLWKWYVHPYRNPYMNMLIVLLPDRLYTLVVTSCHLDRCIKKEMNCDSCVYLNSSSCRNCRHGKATASRIFVTPIWPHLSVSLHVQQGPWCTRLSCPISSALLALLHYS